MDRPLVTKLALCEFTEAAHNVVLVGRPGTGKTHLATAIGVAGIAQHGRRVRCYSTVDLVNALEQEKAQGKARRIAASLLRLDLLILDELGYLPFSQAGGALLFHLLSKLYEHTSVMITTNRRQDDHGAAGPAHAPLPHRGDRQRLDPLPQVHRPGQAPGAGSGAAASGWAQGPEPDMNPKPGQPTHGKENDQAINLNSSSAGELVLPARSLAQYWVGTVAQICIGTDRHR